MSENTIRVDFKIEGMTCRHCVDAVEGALNAVQGARVEEVGIGHARVRFVPTATTSDELRQSIIEAGYPVQATNRID
jgi:copper chaperone